MDSAEVPEEPPGLFEIATGNHMRANDTVTRVFLVVPVNGALHSGVLRVSFVIDIEGLVSCGAI